MTSQIEQTQECNITVTDLPITFKVSVNVNIVWEWGVYWMLIKYVITWVSIIWQSLWISLAYDTAEWLVWLNNFSLNVKQFELITLNTLIIDSQRVVIH